MRRRDLVALLQRQVRDLAAENDLLRVRAQNAEAALLAEVVIRHQDAAAQVQTTPPVGPYVQVHGSAVADLSGKPPPDLPLAGIRAGTRVNYRCLAYDPTRLYRCGLRPDHDGQHEVDAYAGTLYWWTVTP